MLVRGLGNRQSIIFFIFELATILDINSFSDYQSSTQNSSQIQIWAKAFENQLKRLKHFTKWEEKKKYQKNEPTQEQTNWDQITQFQRASIKQTPC